MTQPRSKSAKQAVRQRAKRGQPKPYLRADRRWAVALELRSPVRGRRTRRHIYGRSAEEVLGRAQWAKKEGKATAHSFGPSTSLAEWATYWIEKIAPKWDKDGRRTGMKHSSWRGYEKHVRLNIVPLEIGKEPLDGTTRPMVKKWMASLASAERGTGRGPLQARSIKYALDTLRGALAEAVEDELIPVNVAAGLKPPSQTAAEAQIFTLEEARTFLRAIRGQRDEALYLVSIFAGPRQGETLALRRTDVNLEKGIVVFEHTLDWINGRPVAEENKSQSSRRSVYLPSYVMEVLRTHLAAQSTLLGGHAEATAVTGAYQSTRAADTDPAKQSRSLPDFGLVFIGRRGQPLRGATVYRRFHRLLKASGLPLIRWHDLRHSAASIMLALGMPLPAVQKTIGHANLQMLSQRYGHVVPELAASEVAKLEVVLLDPMWSDSLVTLAEHPGRPN